MKCSCRDSTESCTVIPPFQCVCTCGETEESIRKCRYQGDDHKCVCLRGNGCRTTGIHVCQCHHDPVSCLSTHHYCACENHGPDKCLGTELERNYAHRCSCENDPMSCLYEPQDEEYVCRHGSHVCTCKKHGKEMCQAQWCK